MDIENNLNIEDEQIEYEEEYESNDNNQRKLSNNIRNDKQPPNIQLKQPGAKQKRRSKNDSKGRDYTCGCGKTYLSYPALYTHIRTKHNGKIPDGTNANQVQNKIKGRGRPRKNFLINEENNTKRELNDFEENLIEDLHPELKELYGQNINNHKQYEKKENTYINIYKTICEYADMGDTGFDIKDIFPSKVKLICNSDGLYFNNLDSNNKSNLKLDYPTKSYFKLYNKVTLWLNKASKEGIDISSDAKTLTCDDVFALFLLNYKDTFPMRLMKILLIYLVNLRDYLNKFGWDFLSILKDISSYPTETTYTQYFDCSLIPEMIDDFIEFYIPEKCPDIERQYLIVFSCHFCNWLKRYNLTKSKIDLIIDNENTELI